LLQDHAFSVYFNSRNPKKKATERTEETLPVYNKIYSDVKIEVWR